MKHRRSSLLRALGTSSIGLAMAACSSAPGTSDEAAPASASPGQAVPVEADAGAAAADGTDAAPPPPPSLGSVSAATQCLPNGTIHDPNATTCNFSGDCKQSPYTDNSDWDHGRWKKQCDQYSWMMGVSVDPLSHSAESYWCAMSPYTQSSGVSAIGQKWQSKGFGNYPYSGGSATADWDPGYTRAECSPTQYMSGYSVNTSGGGTGSLGNIRCNTFVDSSGASIEVANTNCRGVTFPAGYQSMTDNRESTTSGDWASGETKLECGTGSHIAGVSTTASSGGRIHGILCCDGAPAYTPPPTPSTTCCNSTTFPAAVSACVANPTSNAGQCNVVDYCCANSPTYEGTTACAEVASVEDPDSEGSTGITVGANKSSAPSSSNGTWTLSAEKANVRGNYGFGAGYDAITTLSATKSTLQATGKGELKGYAILFGKNVTLADVEADGQLSSETVNATVNVVGIDLWSLSQAGVGLYSFDKGYSYTFLNQSKTFEVGPVPVTVSAQIVGTLGIGGSIGFQGHQISAGAGPYLDVTATASAALGGSFGPFTLEAGVQGTLVLFDASIANTATATPGTSSVAYTANSTMTLTEINGSINLFVKGTLNLYFAKYSKTWNHGIVSFSAGQQVVQFTNYNGTMSY